MPNIELQRRTPEQLEEELFRLNADVVSLAKERDAAVKDLRDNAERTCYVCKHWKNKKCDLSPKDCAGFWRWQWRGPQEQTP